MLCDIHLVGLFSENAVLKVLLFKSPVYRAKMGIYHKYLSNEALDGFDRYKYSCKDTNPLSIYVMHPFWNRVVLLCPKWIAPNLLTLVGFMCCIGHYLIPTIYDYDFSSSSLAIPKIPSGAWIAIGILLFLSHTLDGIDGKQARRTGTSSPLGELFDHGCDAWTTVFTTSTFYNVFGNNGDGFSISTTRMYLVHWCVFVCFHISHWEKYNTGVLYLPWGYDISMISGSLLYVVTGIIGVESYKVAVFGVDVAVAFETSMYVGAFLFTVPMAVTNVHLSYKNSTGKMLPFREAVRPLLPVITMAVLCWSWLIFSPNDIVNADPRCFYYMSGTLYANICCRLIVAQMSSTRSEAISVLLVPLTAAICISLLTPSLPLAGELAVLYLLTAFLTTAQLHYAICVLIQMCDHLKIQCFKIPQSKASEVKYSPVPNGADDHERLISDQVFGDSGSEDLLKVEVAIRGK